jgi:hypothetical protein
MSFMDVTLPTWKWHPGLKMTTTENLQKATQPTMLPGMQAYAAVAESLLNATADTSEIDLNDLKSILNSLGVNQRGWRLMVDYWGALMAPLRGTLIVETRLFGSLENLAIYLRLLQQCEMDLIPPPAFVRTWIQLSQNDCCQHLQDVSASLFRVTWKECVRRQNSSQHLEKFLDEELPAVVRWYFRTDQQRKLDDNQIKRGWSYLHQEYLAWRERCTYKAPTARKWQALLEEQVVIDGVRVVELLNFDQVHEEGKVMRHCVIDTVINCKHDKYRVFSLRDAETNERMATLGIIFSDGDWCIDDMRAQDNDDPLAELGDVAVAIESLCRDSARLQWQNQEGTIMQRLQIQFIVAIKKGEIGFREAAEEVLKRLPDGDHLPRRIRLEDLQASYIAVIPGLWHDPQPEIRMTAGVASLRQILPLQDNGEITDDLAELLDMGNQAGLFD